MRLPQLRIKHFMILSLVAAVYLALPRNSPGELAIMFLVTFFGAFFIILPLLQRMSPVRALLADAPLDTVEYITALERALASSRFDTLDVYAKGHYRLMLLYVQRGRYEDAIQQGRRLVRMRGLTHAFEARVHLEIAECLESLGRDDEAEAEREAADAMLDGQPEDALGWFAQAELFDGQARYGEAAEAYGRALELYPAANHDLRRMLLGRLAAASLHAGFPERAAAWAEQLLKTGASGDVAIAAHRTAGAAWLNLGALDQAERHFRRAYDLARQRDDLQQTAGCLATIGSIQRNRGELAAAATTLLQAESIAPGPSREALVIHAVILRTQGHVGEALDRIERARQIAPAKHGPAGRRLQALLAGTAAIYKAELGRVDEAWDDHCKAERALNRDPQFRAVALAARAWLLALRGNRQAALEAADELLARLDHCQLDPVNHRDCLDMVARGLSQIGEWDRAAQCWVRVLEGPHPPVVAPTAWYLLGECRAGSGDLNDARRCFAHAVATGIDSHHARLARERLAALGVDPNTESRHVTSAPDPATSP